MREKKGRQSLRPDLGGTRTPVSQSLKLLCPQYVYTNTFPVAVGWNQRHRAAPYTEEPWRELREQSHSGTLTSTVSAKLMIRREHKGLSWDPTVGISSLHEILLSHHAICLH